MEGSGETALGVVMHGAGADLKFDDLFVRSDDGSVEGLVAVLFGGGDVVFETAVHGGEEGVDDAKSEVAGGDVLDDKAEGDEIVNAINVLVVFGEFFVQGVDRLDAAVVFGGDFFFFEGVFDGMTGVFEFFIGLFELSFGEIF